MMGLRFQCVTLIVSRELTRPADTGVTQGHSRQTDLAKSDHHHRFCNKSTYCCLLKDGKKLRKNNLTIPC